MMIGGDILKNKKVLILLIALFIIVLSITIYAAFFREKNVYDDGESPLKLDEKIVRKDFSVLPNLGILLENVSLYPNLTGYENLLYLAKFSGKAGKSDIIAALESVGLDYGDKRKYGKYSLGMKQRLAIAQAVMEHPDILMLDEPTNALDRESVDRVRQLIESEKKRGVLILLASHNEDDIQILADHVFFLENGSIVDRR